MDANPTFLFFLLMTLGTACLGAYDTLNKHYLNRGVSEQIVLIIGLVGGGLMLFVAVIATGIPQIQREFWTAALGTVAVNLPAQGLFIRALFLSDASVVAPVRLTIAPLVAVTGWFFLGEVASLVGVFGILISMTGLGLLVFFEGGTSRKENNKKGVRDARGVVPALVGSLLFAIGFPLLKKAVVASSALFASSVIFFTTGVLTYLFTVLHDDDWDQKTAFAARTADVQLLLVPLSFALGQLLTNEALNYSLVAYAANTKRLQVFWTLLFAGTLLKEENIRKRALATVLMFAGIVMTLFG